VSRSKEDCLLANWYIIRHMVGQILDSLEGTVFEERQELIEKILEGIEVARRGMELNLEAANGDF
jgi:hypothetical protein